MFDQDINFDLTLTIDGQDIPILSGNVKKFKFDLFFYGFQASIDFWLRGEQDELFPLFQTQKIIKVAMEFKPEYENFDSEAERLTIYGVVSQKSMSEDTSEGVKDSPVYFRKYHIEFADPAQGLWRQHFPCDLLVNKSIKDMIEANKVEGINIEYDWEEIDRVHPILFLGLGDESNEASFYDFLVWLVNKSNGVFQYNYQKNTYKILGEKEDIGSEYLEKNEVESVQFQFPATPRHKVRVMNGYAEGARTDEVENEDSVPGLRNDYLINDKIPSRSEGRSGLEKGRFKKRENNTTVKFKDFPLMNFFPGYLVSMSNGPKAKEKWSPNIYKYGEEMRIYEVHLSGKSNNQKTVEEVVPTIAVFEMEFELLLEQKSDQHVSTPGFQAPKYPVQVEGKVVSETGAPDEETYQIYQDDVGGTGEPVYRVEVPLWGGQQVIVPFNPGLFPGHFFFPAFKGTRVLLNMGFQKAEIKRFLDWRLNTQLPQSTQGNHILFGLTQENQTSINHVYEGGKPVMNMKRQLASDTEIITFSEGSMVLETKEGGG